ncbi:hypothetical protein GXW82_08090 [Streptacidiphilus sp. 4-A2]|nr:hypothetical protein [Streptacidiphilus sp. 4-A2]
MPEDSVGHSPDRSDIPGSGTDSDGGPGVSRRGLVRNAAGAGAAGLAAGLLLSTTAGSAHAVGEEHSHGHRPGAAEDGGEPFIVHVRDLGTGEMEIFHGHRLHRVRDRKLATALRYALR